jgi:hypothetical protein
LRSRLHRFPAAAAPGRASGAFLRRDSWAFRSPFRSALRLAEPSGSRHLLAPAGFCLATTASADFSHRHLFAVALSGTSEISPGKDIDLPRTTAGSTPPDPRPLETCSHKPARPGRRRLLSVSCSSARGFATRFFQTAPRGAALALHFISSGLVLRGLTPPGHCPCWAHLSGGRPSAADHPLQRLVSPHRRPHRPIARSHGNPPSVRRP